MKKVLFLIMALVLTSVALMSGCGATLTNEEIANLLGTDELPSEMIEVEYSVDVSDYKYLIGESDYVFIAQILTYTDTTYDSSSMPITNYTIRVIENIKGNLTTSQDIPLEKEGGISATNDKFIVHNGDSLPKIGQYYIISVYAQTDGAIRACGLNSTIFIEEIDNYQSSPIYMEFIEAYDNQIESDRTRFVSIYEE